MSNQQYNLRFSIINHLIQRTMCVNCHHSVTFFIIVQHHKFTFSSLKFVFYMLHVKKKQSEQLLINRSSLQVVIVGLLQGKHFQTYPLLLVEVKTSVLACPFKCHLITRFIVLKVVLLTRKWKHCSLDSKYFL